jgi:hypothetical protein
MQLHANRASHLIGQSRRQNAPLDAFGGAGIAGPGLRTPTAGLGVVSKGVKNAPIARDVAITAVERSPAFLRMPPEIQQTAALTDRRFVGKRSSERRRSAGF